MKRANSVRTCLGVVAVCGLLCGCTVDVGMVVAESRVGTKSPQVAEATTLAASLPPEFWTSALPTIIGTPFSTSVDVVKAAGEKDVIERNIFYVLKVRVSNEKETVPASELAVYGDVLGGL